MGRLDRQVEIFSNTNVVNFIWCSVKGHRLYTVVLRKGVTKCTLLRNGFGVGVHGMYHGKDDGNHLYSENNL